MKVAAPGTPAARSLREVCEAARQANCGECWARRGDECVFTSVPVSVPVTPGTPVKPARGYHVARFARAMRRGLITGPDLIAVLETLVVFTTSTVVYDEMPGRCAVTAAEERIAAREAELADLKQRFGNMAVRVAALVVHHEMPDAAALPGHGAGQTRPARLRLVPGSPGGRP